MSVQGAGGVGDTVRLPASTAWVARLRPLQEPAAEPGGEAAARPGSQGQATFTVESVAWWVPGAEAAGAVRAGEPGPNNGTGADEVPPSLAANPLLARLTKRLIERMLEESQRRLRFRVHEPTGRIWVQVIDQNTNEVVREIPPERYLDLVARIWELVGLLVDEKA